MASDTGFCEILGHRALAPGSIRNLGLSKVVWSHHIVTLAIQVPTHMMFQAYGDEYPVHVNTNAVVIIIPVRLFEAATPETK